MKNVGVSREVKLNKHTYQLYSEVEEKAIEWLWYPYIPYGKLTLLQGDPGDGKSTCMLNIAASLSIGRELPGGVATTIQNVIYQCAEDSVNDTIKPRLIQAGANCDRIAFIEASSGMSVNDERIVKAIEEFHARLLILDPIQAFLSQDGDMQSASKVRSVLGKLAMIAEKYACAVVLIGHLTKGNGRNLYRGLGSIDIAAIARSVLMIGRDEDNPEVRYIFPVKSSLSPESCGYSFLIDQESGLQWLGKYRASTRIDMIRDDEKDTPEGKVERAKRLLKYMLSEENRYSKEVLKIMKELGISERTVRTAVKEAGIQSLRKGTLWYWHYEPEDTDES